MSNIHIQLAKQKLEKGIQSNKVFLEVTTHSFLQSSKGVRKG